MSDTQIADRDKVRAQELHQKILIHAQLVAQNLWEMCSSLKEMRDTKLYYQLGYMHFDDYCQRELGIKRRQAYQYISIADKLSGEFVQTSAQIGVTKLALLASISDGEREQVLENTDVESVTVRELKEHYFFLASLQYFTKAPVGFMCIQKKHEAAGCFCHMR